MSEQTTGRTAGRELDALVAEKVMGWPSPEYITDEQCNPAMPIIAWRECLLPHGEFESCEHGWICGPHEFYYAPAYSTDITAAWEVLGHLHGRPEQWEVFDEVLRVVVLPMMHTTALHELVPDRAAEAICRAALAAVEVRS